MLKISANTDNIVWVNASRNKTLSNPTYLMSLEHRVSGEKKYFIPQNITSFSGRTTYQEEPRADLFRFGVNNGIENLTGGTRYWTKVRPPAIVYNEQLLYYSYKMVGTDKIYYDQIFIIPDILGTIQIIYDTPNEGEIFTGGTFFADSIDLSIPMSFNTFNIGGLYDPPNIRYMPYAQITLATPNGGYSATTLTYTLETNSGQTFSDTIYVASMEEIGDIKPWEYFGNEGQDNFRRPNYPLVYLGETNITLENYGWYYYRIYEQTSQINLNPSLATNVVDEGSLYLYPPPPEEVNYTGYSNNDITIYE